MAKYFSILSFRQQGFFSRRQALADAKDRAELLALWNLKVKAIAANAKIAVAAGAEGLDARVEELDDLNRYASRLETQPPDMLDVAAMRTLRDIALDLEALLSPKDRINEALALAVLRNERGILDAYHRFRKLQTTTHHRTPPDQPATLKGMDCVDWSDAKLNDYPCCPDVGGCAGYFASVDDVRTYSCTQENADDKESTPTTNSPPRSLYYF